MAERYQGTTYTKVRVTGAGPSWSAASDLR